MADLIGGEVVTEVVKQLFAVSRKAYRCRGVAENLATMIGDVQPTIKEILDNGVQVSPHRQTQLRMFFETLEKCRKLTEEVLQSNRWNMVRQLNHVKKMETLYTKISSFLRGPLLTHIFAEIHHHRADNETRFDRIDSLVDSLVEKLTSLRDTCEVRFDQVDKNFNSVIVRFDGKDMRVDRLIEQFNSRRMRGSGLFRETLQARLRHSW